MTYRFLSLPQFLLFCLAKVTLSAWVAQDLAWALKFKQMKFHWTVSRCRHCQSGVSWFHSCTHPHRTQLHQPLGVSFNNLFITLPSFGDSFLPLTLRLMVHAWGFTSYRRRTLGTKRQKKLQTSAWTAFNLCLSNHSQWHSLWSAPNNLKILFSLLMGASDFLLH